MLSILMLHFTKVKMKNQNKSRPEPDATVCIFKLHIRSWSTGFRKNKVCHIKLCMLLNFIAF